MASAYKVKKIEPVITTENVRARIFTLAPAEFTYRAAYGFSGIKQVNVNSGTVILNGANNANTVTISGGNCRSATPPIRA
jgi:hypothetical protein